MKKVVIVALLMIGFINGYAQSKLIATMLQQIAANAAHIAQIEKGYEVARQGLHFISNAKNGEFHLHSVFFASLSAINPAIKKWSKVADIFAMQWQVVKNYKVHYHQLQESNQFTAAEINFINASFTRLTENTNHTIAALITITTANNYQMYDNERIQRIETLYRIMQQDDAFEQHFYHEAFILARQRMQAQNEINSSRALNNIK